MELLDKMDEDWDAMYEALQKEMQLSDFDMTKQNLLNIPDVDLLDEEGYTPLYKAALKGHLESVDDLISQRANADKPSKGGLTPLHAAAREGHEDIVDYLILQGADVNVECERGRTPLHTAAEEGHTNIMDSLLAEGTDESKKDNTGQTPFLAAVQNCQIEAVNYLISKGAMQNKFDGMTSLYISAQSGHLDMVKLLIFQRADQDEENDSGQVPLHAAASRGHLDVISFLLDHGADVNKAALSGWTPFHAAVSNGHLKVVKYLRNNGANDTRFDEMTPLYIAARAGHLDIVKFLISQGHDANESNSSGHTPFHGAAMRGHFEVTKYLIRHEADTAMGEGRIPFHAPGINCQPYFAECIPTENTEKVKFNAGKTPFDIAVECGRLDLVTGCNSERKRVNEKNSKGEIPLHAAVRSGCIESTIFLILLGADVNKRDDRGTTPLIAAIQNGHVEVVKYLKTKGAKDTRVHGMTQLYVAAQSGHLEMVKFLISQGADVNEKNDSGQVPLHGAASRGHLDVIKFLVGRGADVNRAVMSGWTPCHAAITYGSLDVLKYLKDNGARMDRFLAMTPLYIAARAGHLDLVKFLISQGADVNGENDSGQVPLHGAASRGHLEVIRFLLGRGADVNKAAMSGWTPPAAAISNNQLDVVENSTNDGAHYTGFDGMTPLYIARRAGQLSVAKFLISKGADMNDENDSGQVPLLGAASQGHLEVIELLVGHGSEVNKVTKSGWTSLHAAVTNGHLNVEYLPNNGAHDTEFEVMTPLYIAAHVGHSTVVKFLISQGHDMNELNSSGNTPLHDAAVRDGHEVMEYFIRQGADNGTGEATDEEFYYTARNNSQPEVVENVYTEGTESKHKTPLYIAVECGRLELVKNWIKKGAYVNGTNSNGEVPLHAAARNGYLDITKCLIRQGANLEKKDDVDTTPLLVAIHNGHLEVVKYLKRKGAQDSRVHGMTPLYIAAQSGHLNIVKFLIYQGTDVNEENHSGQVPLHGAASGGYLDVIEYLVKHGAHVNRETLTGSTPFFRAVSKGHLEVVKYLRSMGACMTRCLGMTPLYIAAQNGHSEVVKFIIKEGVDVNDGSIPGRTPLHAASFTGNLDIVSSLVSERANVNAKDGDDWTPLHAATQEGHTDVVTYLINNGADINVEDAEGFSPLLSLSNPGCRHSSEYPTSYEDDSFNKISQKALISGRCQDQGENTNSLEAAACEIIKGDEEQFSDSGVKALLQTALHRDDTVKHSQDNSSNLDPVKKGNRYAPSKSAEEESNTITTNFETPAETTERKEVDMSPFAQAKPKCPVNKAPTFLSLETHISSHKQLDNKYAGTAFQNGYLNRKHNQIKAAFHHLTEKTVHQEVTQSGCGIRREDNKEMKVSCFIRFRGNIERQLEDDPTENTSACTVRTEAFQDQISTKDCTPTIGSISAGSNRDVKNKRRTPDRRFAPSLVLLQIFIRMVVVVAIIQTGRPVLAGGSPRSEPVTLQAGKSGVVPFYIPRPADNTSQISAYYTLRFESKQRPFCINGNRDIQGFKSPSQITRFEIIMIEMTTFYSITLNVDSVDTLDQDIYILTVIFHGPENVLGEMLRKEVLVNIPPGPALCFITLSESSNCPYEVHCQATTGNVETTLTCYQNSQSVEVKGDITDNGQVTRGVFLLPHNTHFSCCSHDVNFSMNEKICTDFEWPPRKHSTVPPTVIHPSLTPSVASTIVAIGNTDEQASTNLAESQVDSGTIKHYMIPSVSLTIGLMIYLFLC